jgi:hypothetical protein
MGKPFIDLTNQTFTCWTVVGPHESQPRPDGHGRRTLWFCKCICGNTAWVAATNLRSGISTNCGCQRIITAGKGSPAALAAAKANTKHGFSQTSLYHRYHAMLDRCYNPKNKGHRYYGARGIIVCDRWRESFQNFYDDMAKSFFKGSSLERDDVNKGYSPENCRWIPRREQNWNTTKSVKTASGKLLRHFCFQHGLDYDAFYYQIVKKGLSLSDTLDLFKVQIKDSLPDISISG